MSGDLPLVHNEWYEFKVFGKQEKVNKLLDLALSNKDKFHIFGQLLSGGHVLHMQML
jgi:hypothetical protein